MPPRRMASVLPATVRATASSPFSFLAPSAATTMLNVLPRRLRFKMYSTINGSNAKTQNDSEIEKIQNELSDLQSKVLRQNEINRDLLRVHIENIKRQINNFKNPYKNNRSVYAQTQKVAQLVEINV